MIVDVYIYLFIFIACFLQMQFLYGHEISIIKHQWMLQYLPLYLYLNWYWHLFLTMNLCSLKQTTALKSGAFRHDIHYWLGKDTSQVSYWFNPLWISATTTSYLKNIWAHDDTQWCYILKCIGWGWDCCNQNCRAWCCSWGTSSSIPGDARPWDWEIPFLL